MTEGYAFLGNMHLMGIAVTEIIVTLVVVLMMYSSEKIREIPKSLAKYLRPLQKPYREKNDNE